MVQLGEKHRAGHRLIIEMEKKNVFSFNFCPKKREREARIVAGNDVSVGKRVLGTILRIFLNTARDISCENNRSSGPTSASPTLQNLILHNTGRSKKKVSWNILVYTLCTAMDFF